MKRRIEIVHYRRVTIGRLTETDVLLVPEIRKSSIRSLKRIKAIPDEVAGSRSKVSEASESGRVFELISRYLRILVNKKA